MKAALRSAIVTWLGLIALQAFSTPNATSRVGSLFTDLNDVVIKVLDPKIPGIPDLRTPTPPPAAPSPPSPLLDPNARPPYFTRIPVPNA